MKFIDLNGLAYFLEKVKGIIPTKTSELTNDSGFLTSHQDISGKLDKTGDGSEVTVNFTQAESQSNIATGEKLSTMFGKISKYFSDLKTVAFSGSYNDLNDKPVIPAPYTLPIASSATLGGIKVGANINIDGDGVISVESLEWANINGRPTALSEFTNDTGFITVAVDNLNNYYDKNTIDSMISASTGLKIEVVESLPDTGELGTIYLVSNGGADPNIYDEYIWIPSTSKFEKIGTTDIDLTQYWSKAELEVATNEDIDALFPKG